MQIRRNFQGINFRRGKSGDEIADSKLVLEHIVATLC